MPFAPRRRLPGRGTDRAVRPARTLLGWGTRETGPHGPPARDAPRWRRTVRTTWKWSGLAAAAVLTLVLGSGFSAVPATAGTQSPSWQDDSRQNDGWQNDGRQNDGWQNDGGRGGYDQGSGRRYRDGGQSDWGR